MTNLNFDLLGTDDCGEVQEYLLKPEKAVNKIEFINGTTRFVRCEYL